jgi:hypothetical protein
MARLESICRVLRDLGIFCAGVAAIVVAVDYLFIHPNPQRAMERAMYQSITEELTKSPTQPRAK